MLQEIFMIKKTIKFLSAVIIAMMIWAMCYMPNVFAASTCTWIMANPAEDCSTSMNFVWDSNEIASRIQVTTLDDTDYSNARIVAGKGTKDALLGTNRYVFEATISNLQPNTKYKYRAGYTNYSSDQYFTTAPASGSGTSFSFIDNGDQHCYAKATSRATLTESMIESAEKYVATNNLPEIAFSLNTGDFCAYGTSEACWEQFHSIKATTNMMWAMCPGNHEYYDTSANTIHGELYFNRCTNNPTNGSKNDIGNTYYFVYGDVLFIAIDSEAIANYSGHLAEMQAWFKNVVENNAHKYIICYTHRPFYTGDSLNAGQCQTSRNNWMSLFDEYGVDLVLAGHNHTYARSYQIVNDKIVDGKGEGTVYLTCSQIGDRYSAEGTKMTNVDYALCGKIDSGTIITVTDEGIELRSIKNDGTLFDSATIYNKSNTVTSYDDFKNSIQITANATFTEASISYDETSLGKDYVASYVLSTDKETFSSTNASLNKNSKTQTIGYEITLRCGEVYTGEVTLSNPLKDYGGLDDVTHTLEGTQLKISFMNNLKNDLTKTIEVYEDYELVKEITDTTVSEIILDDVNPYMDHEFEVRLMGAEKKLTNYTFSTTAIEPELKLSEDHITLTKGDTYTINIEGFNPSDLTYTSELTVNNGVVTANKVGTYTVTISYENASVTLNITVNAKDIELNTETISLKKGETYTITANQEVTYTSSDSSIASVANGVVTAKKAGTATITVSNGDLSKTVTVTVTKSGCGKSGVALIMTSIVGLAFVIGICGFRRKEEQ